MWGLAHLEITEEAINIPAPWLQLTPEGFPRGVGPLPTSSHVETPPLAASPGHTP